MWLSGLEGGVAVGTRGRCGCRDWREVWLSGLEGGLAVGTRGRCGCRD